MGNTKRIPRRCDHRGVVWSCKDSKTELTGNHKEWVRQAIDKGERKWQEDGWRQERALRALRGIFTSLTTE